MEQAEKEIAEPDLEQQVFLNDEVIKEIEKEIEYDLKQESLDRECNAQDKGSDQQYKRLMHLLGRSTFYSKFIMKKLDSYQQKSDKNSVVPEQQKKINLVESEEKTTPKRRRGRPKNGQKCASLAEIVDIDKFKEAAKRKQRDDDIENIQKEKKVCFGTRTTKLGFEVPVNQPLLLEGGALRQYQMEGLEWMKVIYINGVNGILADEMGLGKTVQIIAFICYMIENGVKGPFLLIAPLATLPNWALEFERFAPQVPVILFHGTKVERTALYPRLNDTKRLFGNSVYSVVLTSYQVPKIEKTFLCQFHWRYLIVDEGHALKNINTQLSRVLREFKSEGRMIVTGTPLQNSLSELWALLNFLLPEIFDDQDVFETIFDIQEMESDEKIIEQEKEKHIVSTLHKILEPFLLRRMKTDVDLNLPAKKEVLVNCPMTPMQLKLYNDTLKCSIANLQANSDLDQTIDVSDGTRHKRNSRSNVNYLEYNESEEDIEKIMMSPGSSECGLNKKIQLVSQAQEYKTNLKMASPQMQLRKIANHPYLVKMPIVRVNGELQCKVDEDIINTSGKMLVLDAMLSKLKENGHKVLLFSYFHIMIDLIQELAIMRNYKYEVLTGCTRTLEERKQMIYRFNTDRSVFLFLMTTRAGGLGLNLTAADTVIIFDSDFNPQVDLQAQDRCHRIGQTKPVVVYRFSSRGTVDEKITQVAQKKRVLEKVVIEKGNFNSVGKKRTLLDIQELKEALEAVNDQKIIHPNSLVFTEEELEALLDRRDLTKDRKKALTENNT